MHFENIALFEMRYDFFKEYVNSVRPCTLQELSKKEHLDKFCAQHTTSYTSINTCINDLFGTCSLKDTDHLALHHALQACIKSPNQQQQHLLIQTVLQTILSLIQSGKAFRSHPLFIEVQYKKELSTTITKRTQELLHKSTTRIVPQSIEKKEDGLVPIQGLLIEIYHRLAENLSSQT